MKLIHLLLLICVTVLVLISLKQGDTITTQRTLIKQMLQNPNCTIGEPNGTTK
jgi:hypothetical protein